MATTFKDLSLIAELHYSKLPDAFKIKASEFFDTLDLDGDGIVTLPELLNSNLEGKFGEDFIKDVFYSLDVDGKGHLNFRESLTLYYLCMYSARLCEGCERNIPHGLGYTCFKCWKEGISSVNGQAFGVCLECYASLNYQHEHEPLHLLHDFVLFDNLLHNKPSSPAAPIPAPVRAIEQTVKQCIVCGDYHESGARGFTCKVHMSRMRDSTEFVCEWCFSYLCSKCGNLFRDSTTRAEPGKWLQKFVCPTCHQKNITTDCYDASLRKLQRVLGGVELLKHCRTCEIKHRNGTLFWIVNGTNMVQSSSQQSRPTATQSNARPRNSSFDNQPQVTAATYANNYGGRGAGTGSSLHGSRGSTGVSSRGGRSNRMSLQEEDASRASGGFSMRGGGRGGMNEMYFQDEDGMDSYSGDQGSGGFMNRGTFQEEDGSVSSRSSSGGGGVSNRGGYQQTAAAAVRTVNRMTDVANLAANMFNGINGAGGEDGEGSSGESVFASINSVVGTSSETEC
ncbi:hypothetical protein GOP47_0001582 [Adiantum capillus-veneris]|uniref:Calmodulin n=1 Tax=Adiantum capillus-veneris TaxID=13818 RepID=A0A9D4V8N0_ADICA|nr:hypothetical protein GOP47_0001582 [Adiantum capillus-veneris]